MSAKLGPISVQTDESEVFLGRDISRDKNYSEELAREIDSEVSLLVKDSYRKAKDILLSNKAELQTLIDRLLEKEVVEAKEINEILHIEEPSKEESIKEEKVEEVKEVLSKTEKENN